MRLPYPAVPVELDRPRTLRLTFGAYLEVKESAGVDLFAPRGLTEMEERHIPDVLAALLRHEDEAVTAEGVAEWLTPETYRPAVVALWAALGNDLPPPKEGDGPFVGRGSEPNRSPSKPSGRRRFRFWGWSRASSGA